jgi:hypothetical protein
MVFCGTCGRFAAVVDVRAMAEAVTWSGAAVCWLGCTVRGAGAMGSVVEPGVGALEIWLVPWNVGLMLRGELLISPSEIPALNRAYA